MTLQHSLVARMLMDGKSLKDVIVETAYMQLERGVRRNPFQHIVMMNLADLQDNFQCHGCGKCCKEFGDSGVAMIAMEVVHIAKHLNMTPEQFIEKYGLVEEDGELVMRYEDSCPFLNEENRCTIQEVKPCICRLFPLFSVEAIAKSVRLHCTWINIFCPYTQAYVEDRRKQSL